MSDVPSPPPPPPPPPPGGGAPPPPPPPPAGGFGGAGGPVVPSVAGEKAGFGPRLGAAIIDGLIVGVPFFVVNLIVQSAVPTELVVCRDETAICEQPTAGGFAVLVLVWIVEIAVAAWYYGTFEGTRTQTIGKRTLGIAVVDLRTGQPIGNGRGVGRYFARILSAIPCLLGYLWMLWDPEKQTWHDKLVTSHVVRV